MPPKKKQPANAFYFYMMDRKVHYERNGEKFPNGLKDVADMCGPEWAVLPAELRKKYEDMAKEEKARQKGDTSRKYTNQHRPFDQVDRSRMEEEEARQNMNKTVETTIRALCNTKRLAEFKFYLIHVNYFCITEGDCYLPAELAVCEFSLAEGVTNTYHCIINAGSVPLGYRNDAKTRSETVHHIPLEAKDGETQFHVIWKRVKDILQAGRRNHGGAYPPLYTMPDNLSTNTSISCVKSVVSYLCDSHNENPDDFPIFTLDKLFYELKNACADMSELSENQRQVITTWPSQAFARSRLEEDTYNFSANISCKFHFDEDQVNNCSKSFVQRWAFLICDECCQYLDIVLVPGRHVPENSDVNFFKRQQQQLEMEGREAAKYTPKSFTIIDRAAGTTTFVPVDIQRPRLPQPTIQPQIKIPNPHSVQARLAHTAHGRGAPGHSAPAGYNALENADENFPAIVIGRGRGRVPPRGGGGRGSGPMSFAAAAQKK